MARCEGFVMVRCEGCVLWRREPKRATKGDNVASWFVARLSASHLTMTNAGSHQLSP